MRREKLLDIEPQELTFRVEVRKQASCTIRLTSNSQEHVAFKVMTTAPKKYIVRPNYGILLPRSTCDVKVTMTALEDIRPNLQCKDKFLIKSVVASSDDTMEESRKLFNENEHMVEGFKLRVVYILPSHQRSSGFERSGEGSSLYGAAAERRSFNNNEQRDENGWHVGDLFMKSITVVSLCLIVWYLITKMLPLIWSLTFMMSVFVIKMGKRLLSDSVEDWIHKTILYLCIHFFTALFRRRPQPDTDSPALDH